MKSEKETGIIDRIESGVEKTVMVGVAILATLAYLTFLFYVATPILLDVLSRTDAPIIIQAIMVLVYVLFLITPFWMLLLLIKKED